ncbi:MAG: MFS transporter [Halioglobus sp.]|nr:MFS transporter [Halioglobus sp.]
MGADISTDYEERTRHISARTHVPWCAGVMRSACAMYFIFGDSSDEDGRFSPDNYLHYEGVNAVLVIVFDLIYIFGTRRYMPMVSRTIKPQTGGMLRDILNSFHNQNFRLVFPWKLFLGARTVSLRRC